MEFKNIISHEGVGHLDDPPGRGSGRYGWGTGKNPGQHQFTFISEVKRLRSQNLTDNEIAKALLGPNATTTDLRAEIAIENTNKRRYETAIARELMIKYNNNKSEVARRMGKSESSVRKLLDADLESNNDKYLHTAELLKNRVDEKKVIDIGPGTELSMNITQNTLKNAVYLLEKEGYVKAEALIPQQTGKNKTTMAVLCSPDIEIKETVDKNTGKIKRYVNWKEHQPQPITDYSPDEGKTYETTKFPSNLDSSRIKIRYKEDGGSDKDGVIEIRKGVKDLDLKGAQYAQVRIAVDGTHYLKGMAMYGNDMPDGVDVIFNTNKKKGTPMIDGDKGVLKPLKINEETGKVDKDNPFGALIKRGGQYEYIDNDGKTKLSPINKLSEEGDWDSWSRNLASQFLSKQPLKIINQQIDLSIAEKKNELSDIRRLTNPIIKKKMLEDFANKCDSNASDLTAVGFKNQAFQVLLPIPSLKDNEIYAPSYKDGDTVALVRYPHGGIFEIPILKVNNKHSSAKKVMNNAMDAVGINPKTASILSGADFDGDTALVIPLTSNRLSIQSLANSKIPALEELKEFDPKSYQRKGFNVKNETKQKQMGMITNLITDMTVQGAPFNEISRAVKHSMVVIDSEKHHLDYKQSAKDFKIQELRMKYQNGGGASTIFSRSNADVWIPKRKEVLDKKKMTPEELKAYEGGQKIYRPTGETKVKKKEIKNPSIMTESELKLYESGKKVYRETGKLETVMQKTTGMSTVSNAFDLVRDPKDPKEAAYANYANTLMRLGNEARKEMRNIKPVPVNQSAKRVYAKEVEDLNSKIRLAESNKPKERMANVIAAARSSEKIKSNPNLDYEHKSRIKAQELQKARDEIGAHKEKIVITDREWDAIQAGAISTNKLLKIVDNTDQDALKKRATPRDLNTTMTSSKIALINSMYSSGMYTQKDIAERLGISASLVSKTIRG